MIGAVITGVDKTLRNVEGALRGVEQANRNTVVKGSILVRARLVRQLTGPKGWDPFWGATSPSANMLAARTGQTRQRISPGGVAALVRKPNGWEAAVGSPDAHVLLHETGGRRGKSIIPTAAAQRKPSGTFRWPGLQWSEIPGIFNWPSRAMRQSENATVRARYEPMKPWLAMVERGRLRLMALIVPNVTYRARGMFDAVRRAADPEIGAIGRAEISLVVGAANV